MLRGSVWYPVRYLADGYDRMIILTATDWRPEIAAVWCAAVRATLQTPHTATVLWHSREPECGCNRHHIPISGPGVSMHAMRLYAPRSGVRMFLEEDMIPVRPWSVDDYPGRLVAAQGNAHGQPWPAMTIQRDEGESATAIVPQRFVRDGGCPEWLPADLCEPALRANAKVLGSHFLHLDKMYRAGVPEAAEKNALLDLLRQRYENATAAAPGLGDIVAAGLSAVGITKARVQRLAKAVGLKDCGCSKRQREWNEAGRRFGIG
jgi:hypothetical protein